MATALRPPPILTHAHLQQVSIAPLSSFSSIQCSLGSNTSWEARLRHFVNEFHREAPSGRRAFTSSLRCCFGPDRDGGTVARMQPLASSQVEAILDAITWDSNGLVVAIAQHIDTGAILMQGFANQDAVSATLTSGRATFFSRSRSSLWTKGETSSNFINVMDIFLDCDRDSVIYLGKPDGPACHTGAETCYFTPASDIIKGVQVGKQRLALTTLYSLEDTIGKRKVEVLETLTSSSSKSSWTQKLIKDSKLLCRKIREEADELCRTLEDDENKTRTASEMADVLYHAMVLLAVQDVKLQDVIKVLRERFNQSGIEEKISRRKDLSAFKV